MRMSAGAGENVSTWPLHTSLVSGTASGTKDTYSDILCLQVNSTLSETNDADRGEETDGSPTNENCAVLPANVENSTVRRMAQLPNKTCQTKSNYADPTLKETSAPNRQRLKHYDLFNRQHAAASATSASEFFTAEPSLLLAVHGGNIIDDANGKNRNEKASNVLQRYRRSVHRIVYDVDSASDSAVIQDDIGRRRFGDGMDIEEMKSCYATWASRHPTHDAASDNTMSRKFPNKGVFRYNSVNSLDSAPLGSAAGRPKLPTRFCRSVGYRKRKDLSPIDDMARGWWTLAKRDQTLTRKWDGAASYAGEINSNQEEIGSRTSGYKFDASEDAINALVYHNVLPSHRELLKNGNVAKIGSSKNWEHPNMQLDEVDTSWARRGGDWRCPAGAAGHLTGLLNEEPLRKKEKLGIVPISQQWIHTKDSINKRVNFSFQRVRKSLESIVDSFLKDEIASDGSVSLLCTVSKHLECIFREAGEVLRIGTRDQEDCSEVMGGKGYIKPHEYVSRFNRNAGHFFLFNHWVFRSANKLAAVVATVNEFNDSGDVAHGDHLTMIPASFFNNGNEASFKSEPLPTKRNEALATKFPQQINFKFDSGNGRAFNDSHGILESDNGRSQTMDNALLIDMQSLFPASSPTRTCIDRFIYMLNDMEVMFTEKSEELIHNEYGNKLAIVSTLSTLCYPIWEITNFYAFLESEPSILRELAWHLETVGNRVCWGAADRGCVVLPIYGRLVSFAIVFTNPKEGEQTYAVYRLWEQKTAVQKYGRENEYHPLLHIEKQIHRFSDVLCSAITPHLSVYLQQRKFHRVYVDNPYTQIGTHNGLQAKGFNELTDPGICLMCFIDSFYSGFKVEVLRSECVYGLRFLYLYRLMEFYRYGVSNFHKLHENLL